MRPEIQDLCLQYITEEWQKLNPLKISNDPVDLPPWAVWIRLYQPISINRQILRDPEDKLLRVWFLTERGIEERDPWEYGRFISVNFKLPWSMSTSKTDEGVRGKRYHAIAIAAFADIVEEDKIYLDYVWGWLHGEGHQMYVNEQGLLQIEKTVWVS
jgi:hypothetical protein